MKSRYKRYLKIYIVPILFIAVSFIFTTFAWFAYTGLRRVSTEIDVKAWYIEMTKSGTPVTNNMVITLEDVYPGMETVHELVNIENKGDSDAKLSYKILSARVLDSETNGEELEDNKELVDELSHDYPFHVNIELSKNYIAKNGDTSTFEVSVSWPLDSGDDSADSEWGIDAYNFQRSEQLRLSNDPTYTVRPAVNILISVMAEQYIEADTESDMRFNMGDLVLYDVVSNQKCNSVSNTCLNTYVIDYDNKIGDTTVTLMPSLVGDYNTSTYNDYETSLNSYTSSWTAETRMLSLNDLLNIISHDINNSYLNSEDISPQIIGNLSYDTRITTEITKAITLEGYYTFLNERFPYLVNTNCYWTSTGYDLSASFALEKLNVLKGQIYAKANTDSCRVLPIIIAPKANLE